MSPSQALVALTLFVIMLALGVGLEPGALGLALRRPWLLGRLVLASCLLVPLLGLGLLTMPWTSSLPQSARFAIALMAVCPSAPLTLHKVGLAGGNRQLAVVMQVCAAMVAILSVPVVATWFSGSFGVEGWQIQPRHVALQVLRAQLLPLGLGMLLRQQLPALADRAEVHLDRLATGLVALLVLLLLITAGPLLLPFALANGLSVVAMATLVTLSLGLGAWMVPGRRQDRGTLALVMAMRNPGLALLLASDHANGLPGLRLAILLYLLVTVVLSVPVVQWQRGQLAGG